MYRILFLWHKLGNGAGRTVGNGAGRTAGEERWETVREERWETVWEERRGSTVREELDVPKEWLRESR